MVFAGGGRSSVFLSVRDLITGVWPTPLVRLERFGDVWAKLEFFNALSRSIKDRTVLYLLNGVGAWGGSVVVEEASSGNVAIALAALANIYGFRFRAYTTKHLPRATEVLLRVLGAEVVKVDRDGIDEEFWRAVNEHARRTGAVNLNQFENPANPNGHYEATAAEIIGQLESVGRRPRVFIAGLGTGGHISGIGRRLKERFGDVYVVGVQPARGSVIPGIKRVELGTRWFRDVVDEVVDVTLEEAINGVITIARSEGLLVGLSSGAVFSAFLRVRERFGDDTYLLVFPDDIYKYIDIIGKYLDGGG